MMQFARPQSDYMIGEEASKSATEAQDASLFGPSVNDFIKSRKSGRRKKTGSKSRSMRF